MEPWKRNIINASTIGFSLNKTMGKCVEDIDN
jgi:hypothetical protein